MIIDDYAAQRFLEAACRLAKDDLIVCYTSKDNEGARFLEQFFHRYVPDVAGEIIKLSKKEALERRKTTEADIKKAIEEGNSQSWITKNLHVERKRVKRCAEKYGLEIKSASKYAHSYKPQFSEEKEKQIQEEVLKRINGETNESIETMARRLEISRAKLSREIKALKCTLQSN